MSDKCQHCTEVQVRLDMSMEIARLEAELEEWKGIASTAEEDRYETIKELNQRIAELEADITILRSAREECLIERDRLDIEKGRLQSRVETLEAELAKLKAENQWHPASVPPTHENYVLIYTNEFSTVVGYWHGGIPVTGNRGKAVLWRELDKPPRDYWK